MKVISIVSLLVLRMSCCVAVDAQTAEEADDEASLLKVGEMKYQSPDGKFAILLSDNEEQDYKLQLVEANSRKPVLELSDNPSYPAITHSKLLWAPDSKRFAFFEANRRGGETTVYFRNDSGFTKIELPERGSCATAAEKKELKGHGVSKFIESSLRPKEWLKWGALVLADDQGWETSEGDLRGCTQTVTIVFNARHKPFIVSITGKKEKDY